MNECQEWLNEASEVFPDLKRKKIEADYKQMASKKLGYVSAKIHQRLDFDPEALLLGESNNVKSKRLKPKDFKIFINAKLQAVKNMALRKQIVQHILIHEMLHIENGDLFTLSKDYNRRKKKKIHITDFEEDVFNRFNKLREIKGVMQIQKREHLDIAINRILESIRWFEK